MKDLNLIDVKPQLTFVLMSDKKQIPKNPVPNSASGFVADEVLTELLATLRSKVRIKMTRQGRKKFMKDQNKVDNNSTAAAGATSSNDKLITLHSGILGLCAFVEAFPHDVPSFLPPILMELSTHLNDPQVSLKFLSSKGLGLILIKLTVSKGRVKNEVEFSTLNRSGSPRTLEVEKIKCIFFLI